MVLTLILTLIMAIWRQVSQLPRWLDSYYYLRLTSLEKKYGEKSVVYCHTDGINTNVDVDEVWLTNRLRLILENKDTLRRFQMDRYG